MTKRGYKVGDRVRVVSNDGKNCCSDCLKIVMWFEKHKPVGTIINLSNTCVELKFDAPQDVYEDGARVDIWWAKFKHIQPAGPQPGEQLTFVFTGPCSRGEKEVEKPKKKMEKKPFEWTVTNAPLTDWEHPIYWTTTSATSLWPEIT